MGSPDGAKRNPGAVPHSAALHAGYGIGPAARRRLAAFARTLRQNGFLVGLAETRDALGVLASSAAAGPTSLRPALRALFCATHSDWEKFDEIFEAFWEGRDMRSARTLRGTTGPSQPRGRRVAEAGTSDTRAGLADQMPRGGDDESSG